MKTIHVFTSALALFFITTTANTFAQTKDAATDKQRQANLEKLQSNQAKREAIYHNMTKEQQAVARAKSLERKKAGSKAAPPAINQSANPAQGKEGAVRKEGRVNAKPVYLVKKSKPTPVWQTPKNTNKTTPVKPPIKPDVAPKSPISGAKTQINTATSPANSTKPSVDAEAADKSPAMGVKPVVNKPYVKVKSTTRTAKETDNSNDKK